ncbi:MAG TPA: LuxR C-terminal-related transcriptional regulator, partial [Candidatus Sulfotelmatobacter sp.]|nr:LuxR C-terminal-related transcriptional regulator [Candidatus Sulfotelmatobacter sp.]
LQQRLSSGRDDPELRHILGLLESYSGQSESLVAADRDLEQAYRALRQRGDHRKAALVAVSLGRLHHDIIGDQPVGNGWLARALSLVEAEDTCVEQGWALLALVGCNVTDSERLHANADRALQIGRHFQDVELECKALADGGLASVSLGRVEEGMARLDQAMVMLRSHECPSPIVVSQVVCDMLSACERACDLHRADTWLSALEALGIVRPPDHQPSFLFTHCRIAYGAVLCEIGRWTQAEVALRMTVSLAALHGHSNRVASRAALAELLVHQGRLEAAAELLAGHDDRVEAASPLARLHLARGKPDLAAAVARQGLRVLRGDRLRAARLLAIVVDAELRVDRLAPAQEAASRLGSIRSETGLPGIAALEARARGHVAAHGGDVATARLAYEEGLGLLHDGGWPLVQAGLHLDLAQLEAASNRSAAIADASAALAIFQRLDAAGSEAAAALLEHLGQRVPRPAQRRRHPLDILSRREREVFDLLAIGMSNPAIAQRLFITPKTTEHHVSSILGKLGLRNRAEVAAFAGASGAGIGEVPLASAPALR